MARPALLLFTLSMCFLAASPGYITLSSDGARPLEQVEHTALAICAPVNKTNIFDPPALS